MFCRHLELELSCTFILPFNPSDFIAESLKDFIVNLVRTTSDLPLFQDKCGRFPSLSATNAWPAGAIVVRSVLQSHLLYSSIFLGPADTLSSSGHHKSNHSIGEDQHITAYVCSEAGWNSVPRRSNACVHIYSMDEDVSMGFMGYWIKNSNSNNFKSKLVLEKLQRALENERKMPPNY